MAFFDSALLPVLTLAAVLGASAASDASRPARGASDAPIDSIPIDPGPGRFDMAEVHGHPNLFFPKGGYLVRYPLSGPGARVPVPLAAIDGSLRDLRARDGWIAYATDKDRVGLIDPSLSPPVILDTVFPGIHPLGVDVDSGRLYLAQGDGGLGIWDPAISGAGRYRRYPLDGRLNEVRARDGYVYLGTGAAGTDWLRTFQPEGDSLVFRGEFEIQRLTSMDFFGDSLIVTSIGDHAESNVLILAVTGESGPRRQNVGWFGKDLRETRMVDTSLIASAPGGLYRLDKEMIIGEDGSDPSRIPILQTRHGFEGRFRIMADTVITSESGATEERFLMLYRLRPSSALFPISPKPRARNTAAPGIAGGNAIRSDGMGRVWTRKSGTVRMDGRFEGRAGTRPVPIP